MALRVHALHVRVIVAPLQFVTGTLPRARTCCASREEPDAGAYTGALAVAADCSACEGTERSADYGTAHGGILSGLCRGRPAHLGVRVLLAVGLVETKLIEALPGARQDKHAGTGRDGHATGERKQREERSEF